jgi:hypothetical protein
MLRIKYNWAISIILLFNVSWSFSQSLNSDSATRVGLTPIEFDVACKLFIEMMDTPTYKEHEQKTKEFANLMGNRLLQAPLIDDRVIFKAWLKENITNTKFKSIEDADVFIDEMVAITEKMRAENPDLYNLLAKASSEQIRKIRLPLTNHRNFNNK